MKQAAPKQNDWKIPRRDNVPNIRLKYFTVSSLKLTKKFNDILAELEAKPKLHTDTKIILIPKWTATHKITDQYIVTQQFAKPLLQ